ncbi:MAG: glycosyltransferase family 2 protein [Armatimonadota bacterium]
MAAVVPAYNEAARIVAVISAIRGSEAIDELIVVSDGSTDGTYEVASAESGVLAFQLNRNIGKGGAMLAGAWRTEADAIAFFDADLVGLTPEHVCRLVTPVRDGSADMAVGVFRGGWWLTDWSQRLVPQISGQRVVPREFFLSVPGLATARYGVEMAINRHARRKGLRVSKVELRGVTHAIKEKKHGLWGGLASRGRMYRDILRVMLDGRGSQF